MSQFLIAQWVHHIHMLKFEVVSCHQPKKVLFVSVRIYFYLGVASHSGFPLYSLALSKAGGAYPVSSGPVLPDLI